ncbi:RHS repeat-associated core domain-containing protein [Bordetella flabilis]|nr:RHS repeat-associated core domain-containing protein [Bordetella flabilis]
MPILMSHCTRNSGQALLDETTFTYASDTANFGRLTRRVRTHHDGQAYATTEDFGYGKDADSNGAILYTRTVTTHDGLKVSTSASRSALTGRLWRRTGAQGVVTAYTYDALGRLLTRTRDPGGIYENTLTYDYVITSGTDEAFQLVVTDSNGNKRCRGMDGAGRALYIAPNSVDDGLNEPEPQKYKTVSRTYDGLGRPAAHKRADWLLATGGEYARTGTCAYDDWGSPCRVDYDDGTWTGRAVDPIGLTSRRVIGGKNKQGSVTSGQVVNTYDAGGRLLKVARYAAGADTNSAAPYSTRTMSYDGLGRLRSITDPLGRTTTYEYDNWGRAVQTTLPDGTVVKRRYGADTPAPRVVEITLANSAQQVPETTLGTRAFDGLGRVVSADVGVGSWQYEYDAPNADTHTMDPRASRVTSSDDPVRAFSYIAELGGKVGTIKAYGTGGADDPPAIVQSFTYDAATGSLESASETTEIAGLASSAQYGTHASGRLKSQTWVQGNTTGTMAYDHYTIGGMCCQYTHVDNAVRTTTLDSWGRIGEVSDDQMKVTLTYDPAGRLTVWQTSDSAASHTLRVPLTLDDYGREVGRSIWEDSEPSGDPTWQITQQWNEADLLTQRTIKQGGNNYRTESYGYDSRNRLTKWASSGASPTDRYGNVLLAQVFTFDSFNNVTQVVSSFPDGQSNTASFQYNDQAGAPCMLSSFSNTHPTYPAHNGTPATVSYAGTRLTGDGLGNAFGPYDELGRLTQVATPAGTAHYAYDPLDRRRSRVDGSGASYFYYKGRALVNVVEGANATRLLRSPAGGTAQYSDRGGSGEVWLTASDAAGSVLSASSGANREEFAYSPYGEDQDKNNVTISGYTGQYRDPLLPGYMLGNGYRAYLPALMRFAQADSPAYSPFGRGGINPYAYCAGDPINRSDPSGHFFLTHWIKHIDHDIGNFFSRHAPFISRAFNAAGRWVLNFTQKGGVLSFLPDKDNPLVLGENWFSGVMRTKYLRYTPLAFALKGMNWATNELTNVIHNTTGLSDSWSKLGAMGIEAGVTYGVGEGVGAAGAMLGESGAAGEEAASQAGLGMTGSNSAGDVAESWGRFEGGADSFASNLSPAEDAGGELLDEKPTPPPPEYPTEPYEEERLINVVYDNGNVIDQQWETWTYYPGPYPMAPTVPTFAEFAIDEGFLGLLPSYNWAVNLMGSEYALPPEVGEPPPDYMP